MLFMEISELTAQEVIEHENEHVEAKEPTQLLGVSFGYTYVPKAGEIGGSEATGVMVPSIGLDYFYKISPKFEVGTMIDLELANYLIFEKDLSREKALIVSAVGVYALMGELNVIAGGGVELEKHKSFGVLRFGMDYSWTFKNNWLLAPGVFYDLKEGYNTWAVSINFGKEF